MCCGVAVESGAVNSEWFDPEMCAKTSNCPSLWGSRPLTLIWDRSRIMTILAMAWICRWCGTHWSRVCMQTTNNLTQYED